MQKPIEPKENATELEKSPEKQVEEEIVLEVPQKKDNDDDEENVDWNLKVVENLQSIIRGHEKLVHVNFSGLGLKKTAIMKLCEAIKECVSLEAVHLSDNDIM